MSRFAGRGRSRGTGFCVAVLFAAALVFFASLGCSVASSVEQTSPAARREESHAPADETSGSREPCGVDFPADLSGRGDGTEEGILVVCGEVFQYGSFTVGDELYVGVEPFLRTVCPDASVEADGTTVRADGADLHLEAESGKPYMTANGRCIWCPEGVVEKDGAVMAPLGALASVCGMTVNEEGGATAVSGEVIPLEDGSSFYDGEDLYWLSRIICCESCTEPLIGKIAVGNVVLNRVASPDFPNGIKEVIFDDRFGIQFAPAAGESIYNDPDPESVDAAKLCLEGVVISDRIIYFMNPAISTTSWISDNCDFVVTIGNHTFYS